MSRLVYEVAIDRVRVAGPRSLGVSADELGALIEVAVARRVEACALPTGGTMRASVEVSYPARPGGSADVASAVATGVARAVSGER